VKYYSFVIICSKTALKLNSKVMAILLKPQIYITLVV